MTVSNSKLIGISAQANENFLKETIKAIDVGLLKNAESGIRDFDYIFDRSTVNGSVMKHLAEHYISFGYSFNIDWSSDTITIEY